MPAKFAVHACSARAVHTPRLRTSDHLVLPTTGQTLSRTSCAYVRIIMSCSIMVGSRLARILRSLACLAGYEQRGATTSARTTSVITGPCGRASSDGVENETAAEIGLNVADQGARSPVFRPHDGARPRAAHLS